MLPAMSIRRVRHVLLLLSASLLQVVLTSVEASPQPPEIAAGFAHTAESVVRELAARSANWLAPPAALETLEYDFVSGSEVTRVRIKRGERRRPSVWMGATLRVGFHNLMQSPERYSIELKREGSAKRLTLVAKLKDEQGAFGVEVGNGVENSWRGYFSQGRGKCPSLWTPNDLCRSRSTQRGQPFATPTGARLSQGNGSRDELTCFKVRFTTA